MVLFTGTYVLNLLCAIVPCHATMQPPEAHIAPIPVTTTELPELSLISNNSLVDPVDSTAVSFYSLQRSKRLHNNSISQDDNPAPSPPPPERITTWRPPRVTQTTRRSGHPFPNLVNPLRTMANAFQKGIQQAGGLTHNFGNQYVPFPESPKIGGNTKRNVRDHNSARKQFNETMVYLRNGDAVEGFYMGTMKGRRIIAFQGIPYAEPPVNNLRFRVIY